ncbi:MAG: hypothetical protein SYNGOMJ08_00569 [Candidatus Syntrophoarchaeum sp. GoM_oil]|nr:MAG: hypothetical protein SYNGOMJ08_00569 [Candidatus Syntrophoarchaeum sp. GoM_oil]
MVKKTDKSGIDIITAKTLILETTTTQTAQTDMDKIVGVLQNGSKLLDQLDGLLTKGLAMKGQYLPDNTTNQSAPSPPNLKKQSTDQRRHSNRGY